jgi:hypothetical protein
MWGLLCLSGLLACGATGLPSAQQVSPRQVVDRAIKAHGGAATLAKYPAAIMTGKGTFYGLGAGMPFNGRWAVEGADKMKFTLDMTIQDKPFKIIEVINGKKGWVKIQDMETMEMKKDQLDEEHEEIYAGWVATLAPLAQGKGFKLAPLGDVKVDGKDALGVKVEHPGHRDVNLFFDKKSGLLVKSESVIKDIEAGGKEMTQETLYRKYKTVEGLKQPTDILVNRDGKRYVEAEFTDVQLQQRLDDSELSRP